MIYYTVMIEVWKCTPPSGNETYCWAHMSGRCTNAGHHTVWESDGRLRTKVGQCNQTVSRVLNTRHRKNHETGQAYVATVDSSAFRQWLEDDEYAAQKLGGVEAAMKVRRAKEVAQRAQERAAVRAAKKAAKPSKRMRRLDKALEAG